MVTNDNRGCIFLRYIIMTTLLPVVFARKSYPRSPKSPSEAKKRNYDTSAIVSGVREQATAATATCLMVFDSSVQ